MRAESPIPKPRATEAMLEQGTKDELQLKLKAKEQELEHTLNTLIQLNDKLALQNDLEKDLSENKHFVRESEAAREKL